MKLRVWFTVAIAQEDRECWCDVYDSTDFRVHFDQKSHDVSLHDGVWICNDNNTAPYAPAIAEKLLHAKTLFKWGLPPDLRALIFSSEYNMNTNVLTLNIDDKGNSFTQYEAQLEAAFTASRIIPSASIHLYNPRKLDRYVTRFKV
ncbi:hypothetical protein A0256_13950 [Mucilaginibacter sp. PAMC 26640]|nr:hypothetical protein A0256_13950 [Mucilaginibacter sp. PAMC 26640]